jgi:hypothetical protein
MFLKNLFSILFVSILVIIFSGCSINELINQNDLINNSHLTSEKITENSKSNSSLGSASFSVTMPKITLKHSVKASANISANISKVKITASRSGYKDIEKIFYPENDIFTGKINNLFVGTWEFKVEVIDNFNNVIADGKNSANISKDKENFVNIVLKLKVGNVSINTIWQSDNWTVEVNDKKIIAKDIFNEILWEYEAKSKITVYTMQDLNQNGVKELVFGCDHNSKGLVYAIDKEKNLLWKYQTGVSGSSSPYWPNDSYVVNQILIDDIDNDGNFEIITSSYQTPYYPNRITILDAKTGNLKGENFNPGRSITVHLRDLNNNGRKELICVGINNDLGIGNYSTYTPVIYVLDSLNVKGQTFPYYGNYENAEEIWYKDFKNNNYFSEISFIDKNNDGILDIKAIDKDNRVVYLNGLNGDILN